ncbi:hypothetical protein KJ969_01605 [Patescibacteria group bacterium]|nr:hypothetical protein [Patescibacteria group bacterium]MBU1921967.1 hypothetical protein [Patescibacteria group bacterium]
MRVGGKILKRNTALLVLFFLFCAVFFFILAAQAGAIEVGVEAVGEEIGLAGTDIRVIVARIINVFLGLLAVIALVLVLYGGFLWMTSGGEAEKVDKAKKVLINAAIGLAIVLSAWAITYFIFRAFLGQDLFGPPTPPAPPTYEGFSGALGNGIIDYHYPARGATDVPRNTKILVTFKTEMFLPSFIEGYDDNGTPLDTSDDTMSDLLNQDNVKIFKTSDGEGAAFAVDEARVRFTDDLKTIVFQPVEWLGSASEDVSYTVKLGAGILRADGEKAFDGAYSDGYRWEFEVGTFVDVTPPQVRSVFPQAGAEYPRNVIVQINFNEAIDPTSATGHASRFTNIIAQNGGVIMGTFSIANQYKTVEFMTDELCGRNSCGGDVYCLPGRVDIDVVVRAATMPAGEEPLAIFPYNGVVDMAGNSLDGNRDSATQGPPDDNYTWAFSTSDDIFLEPPGVDAASPEPGESGVSPDLPVKITWDTLMSFSSLNTSNIMLGSGNEEFPVWFTISSDNYTVDGQPVEEGLAPHHSIAEMSHGLFLEETAYYPEIFFAVKDVYQNCFNPAATRNCPKDREFAPWCCDREASTSRTSGPCAGIPIKER